MSDSLHLPSFFRSKIMLLGLCSLLATSCGVNKKNATTDVVVPKVLKASVSVDAPQKILYQNKEIQNQFSTIPFINELTSFTESLGSGLFAALGDGGLGVSSLFDDENKLEKYEGIPVKVTGVGAKGEAPTVFVIGSGDKNCNQIFTYDPNTKKILIDDSTINTLTTCSVKIQASLSLDGEIVSDEKSFDVVLNPTLADYASLNDSTYRYLSKFSALNDNVAMIARWLRDPMIHPNGLKLKYNDEMAKFGVNIFNANALTGAQSVTKLDLSGTDIRDLRGLIYLDNLTELNLSNCKKLEAKDLAILGQLKSLKSLNVSKLDIKDIKVITDNIKGLEELDISGNTQISDLENIENLPNLRKLNASGIGLNSLDKFSAMTQITHLDISNNDFSAAKKQDVQTLVNLYNLSSLNVSKSHFTDEFLDEYFGAVYLRDTLKTFIDTSDFYKKGVLVSEEECKRNINNFDKFTNLKYMKSIEYLDIHGNQCLLKGDIFVTGLHDDVPFVNMRNLQYLDFSDNPIRDLNHLTSLKNLKTLHITKHPYIDEKGQETFKDSSISLSPDSCLFQLGGPSNPLSYECQFLKSKQKVIEYTKASTQTFEVPENVYSISIESCGAGDGGFGGDGANGTRSQGEECRFVGGDNGRMRECYNVYFDAAPPSKGTSGTNGDVVKILNSQNGNLIFASTQETISFYPFEKSSFCRGGLGGGKNPSGANKKLTTVKLDVKPKQNFEINIPEGGHGGIGGAGGRYYRVNDLGAGVCRNGTCNGRNGAKGQDGLNGNDGYLKISYLVSEN